MTTNLKKVKIKKSQLELTMNTCENICVAEMEERA